MPTIRDHYLADGRTQTLRLLDPAEVEQARAMQSSTRRVISAVGADFGVLVRAGWKVVNPCHGRRNPGAGLMYTDRDGLKIIKRMAVEGGRGQFVKVLHGQSADEVHRQAAMVEQRKGSGELEVFKLTDDRAYGYAPAGLVDAAGYELDRVREEQSRKEYDRWQADIRKRQEGIEARLDKAFSSALGGADAVVGKLERAVDRYINRPGDRDALAEVKQVAAKVPAKEKGLKAAFKAFIKELTDVPAMENPHRGEYEPDLVGMAWNFVPGSAIIDEELRMLGRSRRRRR